MTDDIFKQVQNLSSEQLYQLKARISLLEQLKSNIKPNTNIYKNYIILYIKKYVNVPSTILLEKTNPYQCDSRLNLISSEIELLGNDLKLNKSESIKLCHILVKAAITRIEYEGNPVSFRLITYAMSDPQSLLNESYPGYSLDLLKRFVLN